MPTPNFLIWETITELQSWLLVLINDLHAIKSQSAYMGM